MLDFVSNNIPPPINEGGCILLELANANNYYTPPPCTQLIPHPILPWGLFFIRNVVI